MVEYSVVYPLCFHCVFTCCNYCIVQANLVPRTRRTKSKHNYTNVNKRGLQSLKINRVKSKTKVNGKSEVPSTPGSGSWRVELLNKYEGTEDRHSQGKVDSLNKKRGKGNKSKIPASEQQAIIDNNGHCPDHDYVQESECSHTITDNGNPRTQTSRGEDLVSPCRGREQLEYWKVLKVSSSI